MEAKRAIQMIAVALLTTFVIVFIFLSIKGMEFAELRLIEVIEFFIAIFIPTGIEYNPNFFMPNKITSKKKIKPQKKEQRGYDTH